MSEHRLKLGSFKALHLLVPWRPLVVPGDL
jgi:hypothetical protein